MEEYVTKLSKLLQCNPQGIETTNLDYYFDSVNERNFLEILGNNDLWNKVFCKVEKHYNSNKLLAPHDESVCDNILKLIIAIQNTENKQQKVLLLPLIVCLDDTLLLTQHLIHKGFFTNIADNISSILGKVSCNTSISSSDLHWEAETFKKYQLGLKELDIANIYILISAIERGNNVIPDSFINICVFVLSQLSPHKVVKLLDNKNDVISIIQFITKLPTENKLQLANLSNSLLLKFEALREVIYFQRTTDSLCCENQELISGIILSFSKDMDFWKQFLEFYLEYPSRSPLLFEPLGNALNQLDMQHWDAFVSAIRISEYNSLDCKQALITCFNKLEGETSDTIAQKVFQRWGDFINEHKGFLNKLLTTDVIDIVIYHTTNNLKKEQIEASLVSNFEAIHEINNKWFHDETEQTAFLYKKLSKIFVYAMAIQRHNPNRFETEIKNILERNQSAFTSDGLPRETNTYDLFYQYVLTS